MSRIWFFARVAVILVVIIGLIVMHASAAGSVIRVVAGLSGLELHNARIVWLPCNGSLAPFYQVVYVLPPGLEARDVRVAPLSFIKAPLLSGEKRAYAVALLARGVLVKNVTCTYPVIEKGFWRGVEIVTVLYPARVGDQLVKSIEVVIHAVASRTRHIVALTPGQLKLLERLATVPLQGVKPTLKPGKLGIIVVTRSYLLPGIEKWIEWKRLQGYRVAVVNIDELCSNKVLVASQGLRRLIKEEIRKLYKSCNGCYQYLVIIGDDSGKHWKERIVSCDELAPWEVPTAYFYNPTDPMDLQVSHTGYFVPSDVYYATLDGDWDANGNGILGEYPQDTPAYDPYPELAYARIPVRTPEDAVRVLEKLDTIFPADNKAVFAASIITYYGEEVEGIGAQGDTRLEALYRYAIAPLDWLKPVRLYEHYPPGTIIHVPAEINGNLTRTNMELVLSQSSRLVIAYGHGDTKCIWRKVWNSDSNSNGKPDKDEMKYYPFLCADDAPSVKPQLLYLAAACSTAYYDQPSSTISLGEAMLLYGSQYIGMNRISYSVLLPLEDELNPDRWAYLDRLYYLIAKFLFNEKDRSVNRIGDAIMNAIIKFVTEEPLTAGGSGGNITRRIFWAFTYFGDPTRMIYSMPTRFNTTNATVAVAPYQEIHIALQLLDQRHFPVVGQPVSLYVVADNNVFIKIQESYTNKDGVVTFHVTIEQPGITLFVHYPGDASIPTPYEPSGAYILTTMGAKPWVRVEPKIYKPGDVLRILACGFPYNAPIEVYIDNVYVTRLYTNATGCVNTSIIPPYNILPPRLLVLQVVYPVLPEIRASDNFTLLVNPLLDTWHTTSYLKSRVDELITILQKIYSEMLEVLKRLDYISNYTAEYSNATLDALKKTIEELAQLVRVTSSLASRVGKLAYTVENLNTTSADLVNEARTLSKRVAQLEFLLVKLRERIREVSKKIDARLSNTTSLVRDVQRELRVRLEKLDETIDKLLSEMILVRNEINEKLAELGSRVEGVIESLEGVSKRLVHIEGMLDRLNAQYRSMLSELSRLGSSIASINSTLLESRMLILNKIDESVKAVSSQVQELKNVMVREISRVYGSLDALRSNITSVSTRVNMAEKLQLILVVLVVLALGLTGYNVARRAS